MRSRPPSDQELNLDLVCWRPIKVFNEFVHSVKFLISLNPAVHSFQQVANPLVPGHPLFPVTSWPCKTHWLSPEDRKFSRVSLRFLFRPFFKLAWPESELSDGSQEEQLHELDELDEEEEEPLELSDVMPADEFVSILLVSSTRSGRWTDNCDSHLLDNLDLLLTVLCQTMGKFVVLTKFCVIAIVSVKFNTTCHHPEGTNTVSPGRWSISIGRNSKGHVDSCVKGYTLLNHWTASEYCFPPTIGWSLTNSLGVLVGNKHHRLYPMSREFQALVPRGSICMPVPERELPITIHRYGGRFSSPTYLNRSSVKYSGRE